MTAIQELIRFIVNDRMQGTYTKDQILELLNFKLDKEKEQIEKAYFTGSDRIGYCSYSDEYYNETYGADK